jgi:hypothetical protein
VIEGFSDSLSQTVLCQFTSVMDLDISLGSVRVSGGKLTCSTTTQVSAGTVVVTCDDSLCESCPEMKLVTFSGNATLVCEGSPEFRPVSSSSIVLLNASLVCTAQRSRSFGVSPLYCNLFSLVIGYGSVTTQENELLPGLNARPLPIGNVMAPLSSDWKVCISGKSRESRRATRSSVVKSVIVSVPSEGN